MKDVEANSANIAEIRGRAERFLRPSAADDRSLWVAWDIARDVLALVEAAEAAHELVALFPHHAWGDDMRHLCGAEVVRLEEALQKVFGTREAMNA